jgi:type VI secretion system protein ImpM
VPGWIEGPFVFGKLPSHNDFVVRGLGLADRERWDGWLSAELTAAKAERGDMFPDLYDRAPIWRFRIAQGGGWLTGVMAPSVDGAGRRFPIVAGIGGAGAGGGVAVAEACVDRLYDGFANGWAVDELHKALHMVDVGCDVVETGSRWWTPGSEEFPEAMLEGEFPEGLVRIMIMPNATPDGAADATGDAAGDGPGHEPGHEPDGAPSEGGTWA